MTTRKNARPAQKGTAKARTVANTKRNKAAVAKAQALTAQTYDAREGFGLLAKGFATADGAMTGGLIALQNQLEKLGVAGKGDNVRRLSAAEVRKAFKGQVEAAFAKANKGGHRPDGTRWAPETVDNYVRMTMLAALAISTGSVTVKGQRVDLMPMRGDHLQGFARRVGPLLKEAGKLASRGGGGHGKGGRKATKPTATTPTATVAPSKPETRKERLERETAEAAVLVRHFGSAERIARLQTAMAWYRERLDKFLSLIAEEHAKASAQEAKG